MNLLNEGGAFFMYPLALILIIVLILLTKAFLTGGTPKILSIISSLGVFSIVWGFTGQIIGLMSAFDAIQMAGDISLTVLAGGLKISFMAPIFGMIIFLIAKLGIIILTWIQKE
jgi:hypothetical protein